jgi:hypothetical protein
MNIVNPKSTVAGNGVVQNGEKFNVQVSDLESKALLAEILHELKIMNLHLSIMTDHEINGDLI